MTQNNPTHPILIVDDEASALKSFEVSLRSSGYNNIVCFQDSTKVLPYLDSHPVELLLLDLTMPLLSGQEILENTAGDHPEIPVIVATGLNDVQTAVKCMKAGAKDYLLKPVERNRLLASVRNCIELEELKRQFHLLKDHLLEEELKNPQCFSSIITENERMIRLFRYLEAIAGTREPILITGETGTGKELFARAVHEVSGRPGEFVPVNVAGLDDNVFTDTLFGHKKGAFTDAAQVREGLVEKADRGTIFLDEIGDLSPVSQSKLLRLIQEKEFYPLGSDMPKQASAHIVVATNRDLKGLMETRTFRKDLFFRLSVHHLRIPPLRERRDDLGILAQHFIQEAAAAFEKKPPTAPPELDALLESYHFPGNIRELRSLIFDAVGRHRGGMLSLEVFRKGMGLEAEPNEIPEAATAGNAGGGEFFTRLDRLPTLKQAETELVREALSRSGGNQSLAARFLGITRQALNSRLKRSSYSDS